ncbi:unnamed protein product [Leuciscus chuanchicus]
MEHFLMVEAFELQLEARGVLSVSSSHSRVSRVSSSHPGVSQGSAVIPDSDEIVPVIPESAEPILVSPVQGRTLPLGKEEQAVPESTPVREVPGPTLVLAPAPESALESAPVDDSILEFPRVQESAHFSELSQKPAQPQIPELSQEST